MNELANKDAIMLATLLGSFLVMIVGTMAVGSTDMLAFWIRRVGRGSAWLLIACSVVLVATGLGDPAYRELVMAFALVLTLAQTMTFWWVGVAWPIVADQLDLTVRDDMGGTVALSLAATALFVVCSVFAGFWTQ